MWLPETITILCDLPGINLDRTYLDEVLRLQGITWDAVLELTTKVLNEEMDLCTAQIELEEILTSEFRKIHTHEFDAICESIKTVKTYIHLNKHKLLSIGGYGDYIVMEFVKIRGN